MVDKYNSSLVEMRKMPCNMHYTEELLSIEHKANSSATEHNFYILAHYYAAPSIQGVPKNWTPWFILTITSVNMDRF